MIKPVDVIRILGEGSQGIVALCRFKDQTEEQQQSFNDELINDGRTTERKKQKLILPPVGTSSSGLAASANNQAMPSAISLNKATDDANEGNNSSAFVLKVFCHWLPDEMEEQDEVRNVRLQNIENENQVMVSSSP